MAVNVDGAAGSFAGAGQTDADVGGLRFAGAVHDAAHDRKRHGFDALVLLFPDGHVVANVALNRFGQFLKGSAGGAAATGAGCYAGREGTQAEGLEQFAGSINFFTAVAARTRRQGNADGVTDTFVEQNAQGCRRPNLALHAHSGFGEAEVQRLFGFRGEIAVNSDEVAGPRGLARNDDLVVTEAGFEGEFGRFQGGNDHALVDDFFRLFAEIFVGIFLHLAHDELLIEGAAVHADANGLAVITRDFADGGELFIPTLAGADVARIDAVFIERFGAFRIFGEQDMAVVMEIADDRDVAACFKQAFFDFRYGSGGFRDVDRPAHDLRTGFGELESLLEGSGNIGGVRVRHGLHDDGSATADADVSDVDAKSFAAWVSRTRGVVAFNLGEHCLSF